LLVDDVRHRGWTNAGSSEARFVQAVAAMLLYHLVARTLQRQLVFASWEEGLVLWRMIVAALPGLASLVLMPDHLHALHEADVRRRLAQVLSGYTRWRNARRGEHGPLFEVVPPGEPLVDEEKRRRAFRYVHLNPCREGLVRDPLGWPLSTHLDAVGLTASPAVARHPRPVGFHRYVSSDPSVHVDGTQLPGAVGALGPLPLVRVLAASTVASRTTVSEMQRRGAARNLLVRAARTLTVASSREIATVAGVRPELVRRVPRHGDDLTDLIARLAHDPRFELLSDRPLAEQRAFSRFFQR
jgi:REP element-mobilizing transposase RayT